MIFPLLSLVVDHGGRYSPLYLALHGAVQWDRRHRSRQGNGSRAITLYVVTDGQ